MLGTEIKDISQNIGLLPINLGKARLQKSEHTLIHYFDLENLYLEFSRLNDNLELIKNSIENNNYFNRNVNNYFKIINYLKDSINDRIENIGIHSSNKNNKRNKRGLVNGLGTILKTLTGNLDADDGAKYDKILKHIQDNEHHIQNQLNMQYSISRQIIKNFNETVQDIQKNNLMLKLKITQLSEILQDETNHLDLLTTKDMLNQIVILYNIILNEIQNLETSIAFCKIKTLHPSIMKSKDLFLELQKISNHYKNELPFDLTQNNILNFESVIDVNCKIDKNKIIYLLTIPINFEDIFDLFNLLPIPTIHKSEIITIIPDVKYFLKLKNDIMPLSDICAKSKVYQCPNKLRTNHRTPCEEGILLKGQSNNCQFTKLQVTSNHLKIIPEINQYLAVLPKKEKIEIKCKEDAEIKTLQGIYLIKEENCKIIFRDEELLFQSTSHGQPKIINSEAILTQNHSKLNFSIYLKTLKLKELESSPMLPVEDTQNFFDPKEINIWTVILYFCLMCILTYITVRYLIKRNSNQGQHKKHNDINLPGEASF